MTQVAVFHWNVCLKLSLIAGTMCGPGMGYTWF